MPKHVLLPSGHLRDKLFHFLLALAFNDRLSTIECNAFKIFSNQCRLLLGKSRICHARLLYFTQIFLCLALAGFSK